MYLIPPNFSRFSVFPSFRKEYLCYFLFCRAQGRSSGNCVLRYLWQIAFLGKLKNRLMGYPG